MWLTVVIAIVAVWILVVKLVSRPRADEGPQPPQYPGALPLIGHGHFFASGDSVVLWDVMQRISNYADCFSGVAGVRLGPKQIYVISDPDDSVTLSNAVLDKVFIYDLMKPFLGEGLLTGSVPIWKVHRKLLTPVFSQVSVDGFIGVFNSQARRLVTSLNQEDGKKPFDFWPYIGLNTLETICLTVMGGGQEDFGLSDDYIHATEEIYNILIQRFQKFWLHNDFIFNLSTLGKKQKKCLKVIKNVSNAVIENYKSEKDEAKLVDDDKTSKTFKAFINLIQECSGKNCWYDHEIQDEIDTLIVAGHDTSASTILYTLILLGSHPDIQERAFEEIAEVLGDRDVDKLEISKMVFLEAVLMESMRLYPIGPFIGRNIAESIKLKHYTLPAGSSAFIAIHALHRHKMWGEDAELFVPDRWLDKSRIPGHRAAFAAFSLGKRMCIGKNFALLSMKTTLAHLIRSFRFKSDISKLQLKVDIMLKPHAGHYISVERRT
ncbi:cytochrome P450 4C1-like [Choristoneura fumiferana]|uniref:cytochrome P450 4C1-like n=1 Tax=Choristoneura fumiferana TaxID=7141 RepID=UPI003D15A35D